MKKQPGSANKLRLTKKAVDALIALPIRERAKRYWDTKLPNFYLLFTPGGSASYCVRFIKPAGGKSDFTIGRASLIGPDQAREAAKARLAELVLKGQDPVEARTSQRTEARISANNTFEKLARQYVEVKKSQRPPGRPLLDEWVLEAYVFPQLGRMKIETISRQRVKDLVLGSQALVAQRNIGHTQQRSGKVTANRIHGAIRRVFDWALDSEITEKNPAVFKRQFSTKPIKRRGVITDARFGLVWRELDKKAQIINQTTPLAIQLYFLTLQRPIDIARARREHFDFAAGEWWIPWSPTKTEDPYIIPLGEDVLQRVQEAFAKTESDYLFPGDGSGKRPHLNPGSMNARFRRAVRDLVAEGAWPDGPKAELYDFRRFGRTKLVHQLGVSKEVAERVINHAEPTSIDELYDVQDYSDPLREAHIIWAKEVRRMIKEEGLPCQSPS